MTLKLREDLTDRYSVCLSALANLWLTHSVEGDLRRAIRFEEEVGPVNFLSILTGCFATPVAENPTVVMVEAAYRHHGIDARYINCDVPPELLGDAVRGAKAMGWVGFNCSLPHKVAVIDHLDGLGESAEIMGAVNCAVRRGDKFIGENTDGKGFLKSLMEVVDPEESASSCSARAVQHGRLASSLPWPGPKMLSW